MLSSVSALSAQNIGAGKHDRATGTLHYALLITVGYGIVVAIVMQFLSYHVVGLFTDDTVVVRLGDQYLRSYIWDTVFAGIHFSFSGYFCAYGLSAISFIHNVLSILCVLHNLYFYNHLMEEIRDAIEAGNYKAFKKEKLAGFENNA